MKPIHEQWLKDGSPIPLDEKQLDRFSILLNCLTDTAGHMNVTALKSTDAMVLRHFVDSLSLCALPVLRSAETIADIGCGGGFPGLALKIALPQLKISMVDSTEKKLRFVSECAEKIGLSGVKTVAERAEALAFSGQPMRESFDVVTARAVASLHILDELCLPFVRKGGFFLAMKGPKVYEEVAQAENGIKQLGGVVREILPVKQILTPVCDDAEAEAELEMFLAMERYIAVIEKVKSTPRQYPRSYAKIKSHPL